MSEYLTVEEAAKFVGVSTDKIRRWIWERELPASNISTELRTIWRILRSDLVALMMKKKNNKDATMSTNVEKHELHTSKCGIWTIYKKGDAICIADNLGRARAFATGIVGVAQLLVMNLADRASPDPDDPNADEADRNTVEKFINE